MHGDVCHILALIVFIQILNIFPKHTKSIGIINMYVTKPQSTLGKVGALTV